MTTTAADHLTTVIQAMAGPDAHPRPDQVEAVRALVDDRARVLLVQATGWGKSAVYWAATRARRAEGAGTTLVVSPLLALMRDQVHAARAAGLRADTINSTNPEDWGEVLASVHDGSLDVLFVSPERLANPRFASQLPGLVQRTGLLVVDEAHCISDWGFDFRPDYLRIARLLLDTASDTPVLATTATANERVSVDVARQLGHGTVTLRGSLARSSLTLSVVPGLDAVARYAWVAEALEHLAGSGIVYVLTVAESERLASFLADQGFTVAAYSGALDADARLRVEDALRDNQLKAVVATSALGMGYDKPDLAFCIHVGSPSSPVAYYQQVGRAGRALDHAHAVLLPAETDTRLWQYFATAGVPDPDLVDRLLDALGTGPEAISVPSLETATGIRRGRLDAMLRVLAVDEVVERDGSGWRGTGQPWVYDHAKWDALAAVRAAEADLMRSYAAGEGCLMEFLQRALDDDDTGPCGRCSVCTGHLPPPGVGPSAERRLAASTFVRGLDIVIEPRKRWPAGVDGFKGAITGCSEGRALAFADDPGWSEVVSQLRDGPVPPDVADAVVAVLSRWRRTWGERPVAVVAFPTWGRSALVAAVADHIATVGKLERIAPLTVGGHPPSSDLASGPMVRTLVPSIDIDPSVPVPRGPVLLVVDGYRSGWATTVAAARIRSAGTSAVLPLALHRMP